MSPCQFPWSDADVVTLTARRGLRSSSSGGELAAAAALPPSGTRRSGADSIGWNTCSTDDEQHNTTRTIPCHFDTNILFDHHTTTQCGTRLGIRIGSHLCTATRRSSCLHSVVHLPSAPHIWDMAWQYMILGYAPMNAAASRLLSYANVIILSCIVSISSISRQRDNGLGCGE